MNCGDWSGNYYNRFTINLVGGCLGLSSYQSLFCSFSYFRFAFNFIFSCAARIFLFVDIRNKQRHFAIHWSERWVWIDLHAIQFKIRIIQSVGWKYFSYADDKLDGKCILKCEIFHFKLLYWPRSIRNIW